MTSRRFLLDNLMSSLGMCRAEGMSLSSKNSQCSDVGNGLIIANQDVSCEQRTSLLKDTGRS